MLLSRYDEEFRAQGELKQITIFSFSFGKVFAERAIHSSHIPQIGSVKKSEIAVSKREGVKNW